jgi:conjugal transfer pilus assembly protein TraW
MAKATLRLVFTYVFISCPVFAEDKGCFGEVFEIAETDLIEEIQGKLLKLQQSGELEIIQKKIQREVVKRIEEPMAVEGIIHTQKERTFEFDPTIEVTMDLKDYKGKVFAKKGDRYNPLDYVNLTKPLLFIDGNEESHIEWAKLKLSKQKYAKIILVSGNPLKLQKLLRTSIYFDQYGLITKKLGIKQVPAIVFQETRKRMLTIKEEFPK